MCFFTFPAQPWQCKDTLITTTCNHTFHRHTHTPISSKSLLILPLHCSKHVIAQIQLTWNTCSVDVEEAIGGGGFWMAFTSLLAGVDDLILSWSAELNLREWWWWWRRRWSTRRAYLTTLLLINLACSALGSCGAITERGSAGTHTAVAAWDWHIKPPIFIFILVDLVFIFAFHMRAHTHTIASREYG